MSHHYLACDLGAESGRLMAGHLAEGRLTLEEIHRFPNAPIKVGESLCWDITKLFEELGVGLGKAGARKLPFTSISTDSWGVDYLLYDHDGAIISPTFHYRDARCAKGVERAYSKVDWNTIFAETGIQFMPINTLFQLAAEEPARLARAGLMLGIGDGFNYFLSGVARAEESLASTSQLYNPTTKSWSGLLIEKLGLPPEIFPPIVPSGARLGPLRPELADAAGLTQLEVIATCSHDTGAAVVAVPATSGNWAYLSSGTWSLMGVELPAPILNDACRDLNFTNEIGYGGAVRLLKNIIGLWLVQECRRIWALEGTTYDYSTLTQLAAAAPPFASLIDPTDPRFLAPENMPLQIADFCRETSQPAPATPGATIRCALESLALQYRRTLGQVEELTRRSIEGLHIVGGGSQNTLLNQFTANAIQRPVVAGPVESTAAGNILIQAITLGHIDSLPAAREVIRRSAELQVYMPDNASAWDHAMRQFWQVISRE